MMRHVQMLLKPPQLHRCITEEFRRGCLQLQMNASGYTLKCRDPLLQRRNGRAWLTRFAACAKTCAKTCSIVNRSADTRAWLQ